MTPKFSIIVPVYNVAPYLRECLDSILCAVKEWEKCGDAWAVEIICVDDGSTDGSGELIDAYASELMKACREDGQWTKPSIKVIHQTNQGVSAARNRALDEAAGEWVLFLDGDDKFADGWLRVLAEGIAAHPEADLVLFGLKIFDETGTVGRRGGDGAYSAAFMQAAYRREQFTEIRFPGYIVGEDITYLFCCLRQARGFARIPEDIYFYRLRQGSAMNSTWTFRKRWDDLRHVVRCLVVLMTSRGVPLRIYARYVWRLPQKIWKLLAR